MKLKLFFLLIFVILSGCSGREIHKTVLPNGHTLILKTSPISDSVSLHYFLPDLYSHEQIPGLGNFCIRLMLKATQKHSAEKLAELIEANGGSIGSMWDYDYGGFSILATHKNFPEQVRLLLEVINTPRLDQSEFIKLKTEILQEIKNRREDAFDTAYEQLLKQLFQISPLSGTHESISKISLADLQAFYKKHIHGKAAIISVVGNFDAGFVRKAFKNQNVSRSPTPPVSRPSSAAPQVFREISIPAPFVAQTYLLALQAPAMDTADYAGFKILNNILGGKFSSRIFMGIRERRGLGYSLGSFYPSRKNFAHAVLYIQVDPRAGKLFPDLFLKELNALKSQGVSDAELQAAIAHVKGQFIMDHQTHARQSWYLGWFETVGLGYAYDEKYTRQLEQISSQNMKQLSQKYLYPAVGVRISP